MIESRCVGIDDNDDEGVVVMIGMFVSQFVTLF